MPNVTVRVEDADELRAVLLRARNVMVPRELKYAHEGAAEVVVDSALPHVPRRTGKLRRSLRSSGTAKTGYAKAGGIDGIQYGPAIHWGRKKGNVGSPPGNHPGPNVIAENPFLVEAAKRSRSEILTEFEKAIRRVVASINT